MKLFEPGKIGKMTVKNRIVMAPMAVGALAEPDGRLSQRGIDYYVARAKGGTGLIITCAARVTREIEQLPVKPLVRQLMADSQIFVGWMEDLAEGVHDYGAKLAVQLTAGVGRVAPIQVLVEHGVMQPVAPSVLPCYADPRIMTRALSTEEVERLARSFGIAARILHIAGVDAVELHAHEGYLFDQFQTALWNKRTDKYGGTLEGRLRFATEVIEAIKKGAGADFPVIYRYGLTHYLDGGRQIDEGLEIARRLEAVGVDAFDIDAGCYENWYWPHPPTYQPPGCMVNLAEAVKKAVKVPVMAVGRLGYPELAERVLQKGQADLIGIGRALLADPEWPNKVKEGRLGDIRPCIGCHECIQRIMVRKSLSCAVNPAAGREKEFALLPAEKKKSVHIIGGGPGGLVAAWAASLRGHKVTLWEKGKNLGGNLIPASIPEFKQDYKLLTDYLIRQVKKQKVSVKLGREATLGEIKKLKPNAVLVAMGANPIIPNIPGVDKKQVMTAQDLLLSKKKIGESVVVVGGGLVGCETALYLAQRGKQVTIVEILEKVLRDVNHANRDHLLKLLADAGVHIFMGRNLLEITENGINMADKSGMKTLIRAETVVLAVGLEPRKSPFESLKGKIPEWYTIGDAVEARKVKNAIWEGYRTARLI